jgi:hypothetical protein
MKRGSTNVLVSLCSIAAGLGVMAWCHWLEQGSHRAILTGYDGLWQRLLMTAIASLSLPYGFVAPTLFWVWPLLIAYSFYFAGFFLLEHWGQVPPLELILMTGLALPGIFTGFLGACIRGLARDATVALRGKRRRRR